MTLDEHTTILYLLLCWNVLLTVFTGYLLMEVDTLGEKLLRGLKAMDEFSCDVKRNVTKVFSRVEVLGKAQNALAKAVAEFMED